MSAGQPLKWPSILVHTLTGGIEGGKGAAPFFAPSAQWGSVFSPPLRHRPRHRHPKPKRIIFLCYCTKYDAFIHIALCVGLPSLKGGCYWSAVKGITVEKEGRKRSRPSITLSYFCAPSTTKMRTFLVKNSEELSFSIVP